MADHPILVDSSVWIQCFKPGPCSYRGHLDQLLADNRVATCGPVKAEVLSGARSAEDFRRLLNWFDGLPDLSMVSDEHIWDRIAESRFKLARTGIQQRLIDLFIAWTAHYHNVPVWSLDQDFEKITNVVPFKLYKVSFQ